MRIGRIREHMVILQRLNTVKASRREEGQSPTDILGVCLVAVHVQREGAGCAVRNIQDVLCVLKVHCNSVVTGLTELLGFQEAGCHHTGAMLPVHTGKVLLQHLQTFGCVTIASWLNLISDIRTQSILEQRYL